MNCIIKPLTNTAESKIRFAFKDINDGTSPGRWEYLSSDDDINDDGWFKVGEELTYNTRNTIYLDFSQSVLNNGQSAGGTDLATEFTMIIGANSKWFIDKMGGHGSIHAFENYGDQIHYNDIKNLKTYFYELTSCVGAKYSEIENPGSTFDKYIAGNYILKKGGGSGLGAWSQSRSQFVFTSDSEHFYNYINRGFSIGTGWLNYCKNTDSGKLDYSARSIIYIGDPVLSC